MCQAQNFYPTPSASAAGAERCRALRRSFPDDRLIRCIPIREQQQGFPRAFSGTGRISEPVCQLLRPPVDRQAEMKTFRKASSSGSDGRAVRTDGLAENLDLWPGSILSTFISSTLNRSPKCFSSRFFTILPPSGEQDRCQDKDQP
jgi:hypothetical protein